MILDNNMARMEQANVMKIKNYIDGSHKVLGRKDFTFGGNTFSTAKIVLQSIKSVLDFHANFICGNKTTITGEKDAVALLQSIYKRGFFNKTDYEVAKSIYTYGNAYEYVYRNEKGVITSKIINSCDAYPIYNGGLYSSFEEKWTDLETNIEHETIYTNKNVVEYENGIIKATYKNACGILPIHYTSGECDKTNLFGRGVVDDLIPIMNEIEQLLSKMSDSVTTLSLNPLGVSMGDRVDSSVDTEVTGAVLNVESGGDFKWATANLDYQSIKLLLDNLLSQFYTIAQVPSSLFGNGNVANVSEVSLSLLFNQSQSIANRVSYSMLEGIYTRLEAISNLVGVEIGSYVDIDFNYNKPVDTNSVMKDLEIQFGMGAISVESIMRNSPYTSNIDREMELLKMDKEDDVEMEE